MFRGNPKNKIIAQGRRMPNWCVVLLASLVSSSALAFNLGPNPLDFDNYLPGGAYSDKFSCAGPVGIAQLNSDSAFSVDLARWLAWASLRAYHLPSAQKRFAEHGFELVETIENGATGLEAIIASNSDSVVISYAGTLQPQDFITDFNFAPTEDLLTFMPGKIHTGFLKALDASWNQIEKTIEKHAVNGKKIFVTGHSLGASMATLTAYRLAQKKKDIASVYLYAPPRVGNAEFVTGYNSLLGNRTFRILNNQDMVAHLPPAAEAADAFGDLFPSPIKEKISQMLTDFNYGSVGVREFTFNDSGVLLNTDLSVSSPDLTYWSGVFARSANENIFQIFRINSKLILDHIPTADYCYLEKALNNSIK